MSIEQKLCDIRDAIQIDVGNRGLVNLFSAFPDDFARACRSLAEHPGPILQVITGFYIPSAKQAETDGPLGAVYLARTLPSLNIAVQITSDPFCRKGLLAGLKKCGRVMDVPVLNLLCASDPDDAPDRFVEFVRPTHLLAIERVGPSHTPESIGAQPGADEKTIQVFCSDVPIEYRNRSHTMRGIDITEQMCDAASWFDQQNWADGERPVTIGVGDGGNEIGMGKVPWPMIRRDIANGAIIACRVATDHLIVAGISNWGAYALASGVALLKGVEPPEEWFDEELEHDVLAYMVEEGPLVDGVSGQFIPSVDGLIFSEYVKPLQKISAIVRKAP